MFATMTQYLEGVAAERDRRSIRAAFGETLGRVGSQGVNSPALVISAGGATTAKTGGSDFYAVANGVLVKVAASTTLPALTGITAAQNAFNVAMFFVDAAGVVTVAGGTAGTTLAKLGWPQFPANKALIGWLLITNTGGAFTGGSTPLDTATTVYFNQSPFNPTVLIG